MIITINEWKRQTNERYNAQTIAQLFNVGLDFINGNIYVDDLKANNSNDELIQKTIKAINKTIKNMDASLSDITIINIGDFNINANAFINVCLENEIDAYVAYNYVDDKMIGLIRNESSLNENNNININIEDGPYDNDTEEQLINSFKLEVEPIVITSVNGTISENDINLEIVFSNDDVMKFDGLKLTINGIFIDDGYDWMDLYTSGRGDVLSAFLNIYTEWNIRLKNI